MNKVLMEQMEDIIIEMGLIRQSVFQKGQSTLLEVPVFLLDQFFNDSENGFLTERGIFQENLKILGNVFPDDKVALELKIHPVPYRINNL